MKHLFPITLVVLLLACNTTENTADNTPQDNPEKAVRSAPFSRGVNFSGWFEPFSAGGIPFTQYTEQDFADVKSLGADVIRLPIRMNSMTLGPPEYTLDPLLAKFLDYAVNWAEKYEIYLIIDNHSFDPDKPTETDIDKILLPVWRQIAERYKNRSDYIIYEVLNEPHGISDQRWGEIQGKVIETIRAVDQKHAIVVGGAEWNSIDKLSALPKYSDPNLIYTFHFYDPFLFTHQGANWGEPLLVHLKDIPFPPDKKRMPKIPAKLRGTWLESSLRNSYAKDGAPATLYRTLDKAVRFSRERDVPVFCGEFGVYMIHSSPDDRVKWYECVASALDRRNIARTSWDYYGGFGIFKTPDGRNFNADLNVDVVRAMGFTPPPQQAGVPEPLSGGFTLFDDFPGTGISAGYWGEKVDFSLYDTRTAAGEFAIRWGNADRYNQFWFVFYRNGDFSELARTGYSLSFMARTERAVSFDVRFLNYESETSIPWRMRYAVNETTLPPDGKWHAIRIPLADMREQGAWINATQKFVSPRGEFSWERVKQLDFVAEDGDLHGRTVWFDSIQIVGP
jgi:endoglucanase